MHTTHQRRSSEVAPMLNLHPEPPPPRTTGAKLQSSTAARRLSKMHTMTRSSAIAQTALLSASSSSSGENTSTTSAAAAAATPVEPQVGGDSDSDSTARSPTKVVLFSSMARSVISQRKIQQHAHIPEDSEVDVAAEVRAASVTTTATATTSEHDPWSTVLQKVARKVAVPQPSGGHTGSDGGGSTGATASEPRSARISLVHVLKSSGVKNLVQQAVATQRWTRSSAFAAPLAGPPALSSEPRSAVMEHWVKTAMLRHQTDVNFDEDDNDDADDDDAALGIESGFDVRASKSRHMYGRTLLLEESCRRAFAQSGENRSQMDLQALKAWFQMTKLKITTDFERLQPAELDLLCRRMVLAPFHAKEVVFRQGDDGDALYLVFSGVVEVRVGQRILGEKVEVTVCELSKGDYFGERALLSNEVRAATVLAKTATELVRISRMDYNIMLKKDQIEFLSRMQMANGLVALPKSAQQSQRAYVKVLTKKKSARTKSDIDMLSEYLQTLKFFRALPKSFVRELCTVVDSLKLPAGAAVFREGEVGDLFYIIFSGSVDVIVSSKDVRGHAQQTKLINLTEGAHFGELALMKGHGIRSATVVTREECRFLVICEKDYNATLRRMQKEDLAKRVGVLDRIPIFQTPEWTGELLKEMSYVLSEQRLAAGRVLFTQGDKALHVFFVVRGELVVTKDIGDPASHDVHTAFVERIGRYRVVGDDAAAGTTFNEILFREVTVTATTPVEVLVLSKYDVFHRLSRAAREAMRSAAHSHEESVVYLDRFHKTDKWAAYKQRVLRDHMNHERLAKILVQTPRGGGVDSKPQQQQRSQSKRKTPKTNKTNKKKAQTRTDVPGKQSSRPEQSESESNQKTHSGADDTSSGPSNALAAQHESVLVSANEFILLPPHDVAAARAAASTRTIGHFVSTFNADAPPSVARKGQLADVLRAERRRCVQVLNEGNPLEYFDLEIIKRQEKKRHAEARGRAASTRRTMLVGGANQSGGASSPTSAVTGTPMTSSSPFCSALDSPGLLAARSAALTDRVATDVLNQLGHENFVFSRPVRLDDDDDDAALGIRSSHYHHSHYRGDGSGDADDGSSSQRTAAAALRAEAEQLCDGDFVVMCVKAPGGGSDDDDAESDAADDRTVRSLQSPVVQILGVVSSLSQARELALREQTKDAKVQRASCGSASSETDPTPAATVPTTSYFLLPKRKYAVLPCANRSRAADELLQRELMDRCTRTSTAPNATSAPSLHSRRLSAASPHCSTGARFPERAVSTAPAASPTSLPLEASGLFASFQKILFTTSELRGIASGHDAPVTGAFVSPLAIATATATATPVAADPTIEPARPRLFAVVSVILSKHEIENSVCDAPFVCVHQLFASEAQAADAALHMTPQHFCNALLCVLPVGERMHLEDAYDWCIQVESDRREMHSSSHAATLSPNRTKMSMSALPSSPPSPSRMGLRRTNSKAISGGGASPLRFPTALAAPPGAPEWQVEREKAHRLHQFICSRLGQKAAAADKERREQQEASGFTPNSLLTLEDKLATLHEYLESSNAVTAGARSGGVALGKYRQMKRFGSIMRARIGSTLTAGGPSLSLLASGSSSPTSSPAPMPSSPGASALSLAAAAVSAMAQASAPRKPSNGAASTVAASSSIVASEKIHGA